MGERDREAHVKLVREASVERCMWVNTMASVNKVTLIGNLGNDPEIRHMNDGTAVATLSIVTTDTWKDKNGEWIAPVFPETICLESNRIGWLP